MAMLDIANRIDGINEQQLTAGNERDAALLSSFQNRLTLTLLLTILLGLGMAAFSTWKILKLENRAHLQYKDVVEARSQLENLSARLVQAQETERRSLAREHVETIKGLVENAIRTVRNMSLLLRPSMLETSD